jgi:hypothetical protein
VFKLDRFEGTPSTYKRYIITVDTPLGKRKAIVYIMNDWFEPCPPNPRYLNTILRGYKQWGLPADKLARKPSELDYQISEQKNEIPFYLD